MLPVESPGAGWRDQPVLRELVRYLAEHPDAKDTLEGILRWWLPEDRAWRVAELREALDTLVALRWVVVRPGVRIYGANPEHLREMRAFVAANGSD